MDRATVRRRSEQDREAGSATVFIVALTLILLAVAGLVVDGGLAINARQRVNDDVEQAARAGSLKLDLVQLRDDNRVQIAPDAATQAAGAFLTARGYPAGDTRITADGDQITVSAVLVRHTTLLSLVGIKTFTVRAAGQARPSVGIVNGVIP